MNITIIIELNGVKYRLVSDGVNIGVEQIGVGRPISSGGNMAVFEPVTARERLDVIDAVRRQLVPLFNIVA